MEQQPSEEQIKALQEKIKNMSPEELKEFQKKQCIFCQIILGKVQSKRVYEDEHVVAVLDINPANPGHLLIMPKEHYSIMPQIPEDEIEHVFRVVKVLSNALLRSLEAQGSNIMVANGVAAGQKAQHFMVHLIPRKENDNIPFEVPQNPMAEEKLQQISEELSKSLAGSEQPEAPLLLPKKEAVEAEFEETPKEKKQVPKQQPKKKLRKKEPAKEQKKSESKSEGADLDDIARILGAK